MVVTGNIIFIFKCCVLHYGTPHCIMNKFGNNLHIVTGYVLAVLHVQHVPNTKPHNHHNISRFQQSSKHATDRHLFESDVCISCFLWNVFTVDSVEPSCRMHAVLIADTRQTAAACTRLIYSTAHMHSERTDQRLYRWLCVTADRQTEHTLCWCLPIQDNWENWYKNRKTLWVLVKQKTLGWQWH